MQIHSELEKIPKNESTATVIALGEILRRAEHLDKVENVCALTTRRVNSEE